ARRAPERPAPAPAAGGVVGVPDREGRVRGRGPHRREPDGDRAVRLADEFEESWLTSWLNAGSRTTTLSGRMAARWGDDYRNARDLKQGEDHDGRTRPHAAEGRPGDFGGAVRGDAGEQEAPRP